MISLPRCDRAGFGTDVHIWDATLAIHPSCCHQVFQDEVSYCRRSSMRKCRIAASCASYLLENTQTMWASRSTERTRCSQESGNARLTATTVQRTECLCLASSWTRALTGLGSSLLLSSSLYVGWWFADASVDSGIGPAGTLDGEPGNRQTG